MDTRRALPRRARLFLLSLLAVLFVGFWSGAASAYPWMIRHKHTGCTPCHADPSGSGLLTRYGRMQGELLLRTPYNGTPDAYAPDSAGGLLWGLVQTPDWLLLGGSFRNMLLVAKEQGGATDTRFIEMQADLKAFVKAGPVRAGGSLGYVHEGALATSITRNGSDNLVSREHWVGVDLSEGTYLIRAGRMNLPYGIRNVEHTMWIREATRTNINDAQQHGLAFAYNGGWLRGEIMGIAGNFQMGPDAFRERGYSGYLEASFAPHMAVGISSLVTHSQRDVELLTEDTRQAHGGFFRISPFEQLVLLGQGDAILHSPKGSPTLVGYAGMLQADFEPFRGIHAMATGEILGPGDVSSPSLAGWLSLVWFFAPHCDVRIDGLREHEVAADGTTDSTSLLAQLHLYL